MCKTIWKTIKSNEVYPHNSAELGFLSPAQESDLGNLRLSV